MVSEPCGRGAGVLSPQRDAPVTASGCKQHMLPQHRGCVRKGAVNQGGTTEGYSCLRPCRALKLVRAEAFFIRPSVAACGIVPCGPLYIIIANREGTKL